jgi:aspartyl-tRNA(Asn)/glutamyl-tRNA(Gln) amidotransferase subunit C
MDPTDAESILTEETVRHVAHLARIALSDKEVKSAIEDLTIIFSHIDCLKTINTTNVDPLDHPTELINHLRNDESIECLSQEQVLFNAPAVKDTYFDVPKVLGDSA